MKLFIATSLVLASLMAAEAHPLLFGGLLGGAKKDCGGCGTKTSNPRHATEESGFLGGLDGLTGDDSIIDIDFGLNLFNKGSGDALQKTDRSKGSVVDADVIANIGNTVTKDLPCTSDAVPKTDRSKGSVVDTDVIANVGNTVTKDLPCTSDAAPKTDGSKGSLIDADVIANIGNTVTKDLPSDAVPKTDGSKGSLIDADVIANIGNTVTKDLPTSGLPTGALTGSKCD